MGNSHTQMWVCQGRAGVDISHYASIGFKVCNCSNKDADNSAGLQTDPLLEVMPHNSRKCCNCWMDRSRGYFDACRFPWGMKCHYIHFVEFCSPYYSIQVKRKLPACKGICNLCCCKVDSCAQWLWQRSARAAIALSSPGVVEHGGSDVSQPLHPCSWQEMLVSGGAERETAFVTTQTRWV